MTNVSFLGEWLILGIEVEGLNLEKTQKRGCLTSDSLHWVVDRPGLEPGLF